MQEIFFKAKSEGDLAKVYIDGHYSQCKDQFILFVDGKIIAKKSSEDMLKIIKKENIEKEPSFWKQVEIVKNYKI